MSEYHAVQVAATDRPAKTATKQMLGHFKKAGVDPKRIVKEFPVTPDAHVPIGVYWYLIRRRLRAHSEVKAPPFLQFILSPDNMSMSLQIRMFSDNILCSHSNDSPVWGRDSKGQ